MSWVEGRWIAPRTAAVGGGSREVAGDPPLPAPAPEQTDKVAGEVSAAQPSLSFGSPGPPTLWKVSPGRELERVARAGGAGRAGWAPGPPGAPCALSWGLPFKVTVLGLRLRWGGGGQGAGPVLRRSSPAPFGAGWPPLLGFPPPVLFFPLPLSLFPLNPR